MIMNIMWEICTVLFYSDSFRSRHFIVTFLTVGFDCNPFHGNTSHSNYLKSPNKTGHALLAAYFFKLDLEN